MVVYDEAPVNLLIGRNCPGFKDILVKAEGLDHILSITARQQACMEADDIQQTVEQQDSNGFMPTPLTDILGGE